MDDMEKMKKEYSQLRIKSDNLKNSLNNYANKLKYEIENIRLILEEQPFTILHSEDYYNGQKMEKRNTALTLKHIINEEWSIDKNGNVIEISKTKYNA